MNKAAEGRPVVYIYDTKDNAAPLAKATRPNVAGQVPSFRETVWFSL